MTVRADSTWIGALNFYSYFLFCLFHEDDKVLPKMIGVDIYHDLYFMICILLYIIESICWSIYWITGLSSLPEQELINFTFTVFTCHNKAFSTCA
jgi:hypothetical protein